MVGLITNAWEASSRRRIIRIAWRSSRWLCIALLAWAVFNASVPILMALSTGHLVGDVPDALHHGLSSPAGRRLLDTLIVFAVLYSITLMLSPIENGLSTIVRVRLTYEMQDQLMRSLSTPVGIEHLEDPSLLDRIALARGSLTSVYSADAPMTLAQLISQRLGGALGCVAIGLFRWWIALLIALFWIVVRRELRKIPKAQVATFATNASIMRRADYFNRLATRPETAKENRVFGLGTWIVDELRRHWEDGMAASWVNTSRYYRSVLRWFTLPMFVLYVGVCGYLAYTAYDHAVSLTTITIVLVMLFRSFWIGSFSLHDASIEWQVRALPEIAAIEDAVHDGTIMTGTLPSLGLPRQAITFEATTFRYPGATRDIVSGLNLEIPAGASTAIVGANGAGKTTLVKLLARLHEPTGGRITVDGLALDNLDPNEWQQRVAIVYQDFNQYPVSAYDNVVFGAVRFADDIDGARDAARRAGADTIIDSLPSGWDTALSREFENGTDLSGGQWQRVALARALFATAHGATVLVLDEPTAWLDVQGEAAFYERFLDITRGLTTVVISHRFSTVRLADHICVLENGRLVERGNHEGLMALDGKYAELFRLQASRFVDRAPEADGP